MELNLSGKIAVVTGASAGIGLATAKEFVKENAKIAICSSNYDRIKSAADELKTLGAEVYFEEVDMRDEASVYRFGQNVIDKYGKIDCWVNNVGAQLTKKDDEEEYSNELLERIYAICFKSALFGCQAAFRSMKTHGGAIVNISSLGGRCPTTGKATLYGPLKSAVNMLTTTMAAEYAAWGVRVNCIAPGYTMTEFNTANTNDVGYKHICNGTLLNRPGTVEEIAKPIVFMCSDAAAFITGETLEVSGGRGKTLNPMFSYEEKLRKEQQSEN